MRPWPAWLAEFSAYAKLLAFQRGNLCAALRASGCIGLRRTPRAATPFARRALRLAAKPDREPDQSTRGRADRAGTPPCRNGGHRPKTAHHGLAGLWACWLADLLRHYPRDTSTYAHLLPHRCPGAGLRDRHDRGPRCGAAMPLPDRAIPPSRSWNCSSRTLHRTAADQQIFARQAFHLHGLADGPRGRLYPLGCTLAASGLVGSRKRLTVPACTDPLIEVLEGPQCAGALQPDRSSAACVGLTEGLTADRLTARRFGQRYAAGRRPLGRSPCPLALRQRLTSDRSPAGLAGNPWRHRRQQLRPGAGTAWCSMSCCCWQLNLPATAPATDSGRPTQPLGDASEARRSLVGGLPGPAYPSAHIGPAAGGSLEIRADPPFRSRP